MQKSSTAALVALVFMFLLSYPLGAHEENPAYKAQVEEVLDGDTVRVRGAFQKP